MTKLEKRKSRLVFQTTDIVRERGRLREVVIEAHQGYAEVRLAGMRTSFPISYAQIYQTAARLQVERERAEKRAEKKAAKRAR